MSCILTRYTLVLHFHALHIHPGILTVRRHFHILHSQSTECHKMVCIKHYCVQLEMFSSHNFTVVIEFLCAT